MGWEGSCSVQNPEQNEGCRKTISVPASLIPFFWVPKRGQEADSIANGSPFALLDMLAKYIQSIRSTILWHKSIYIRPIFVRDKSNRPKDLRGVVPRAVFDAGDYADTFPLLERRFQPLSVGEGELEQETGRMSEVKGELQMQ